MGDADRLTCLPSLSRMTLTSQVAAWLLTVVFMILPRRQDADAMGLVGPFVPGVTGHGAHASSLVTTAARICLSGGRTSTALSGRLITVRGHDAISFLRPSRAAANRSARA